MDSQTLQALLAEVRPLRQELQTIAVAGERTPILIYRLQVQEAAVGRELQRLDYARSKLAATQLSRTSLAVQIKTIEDKQSNIKNPLEQKETEDLVAQLKARFEISMPEEQERQRRLTDCEEQLRLEQAKLTVLHDELEQLDRALKNSVRP